MRNIRNGILFLLILICNSVAAQNSISSINLGKEDTIRLRCYNVAPDTSMPVLIFVNDKLIDFECSIINPGDIDSLSVKPADTSILIHGKKNYFGAILIYLYKEQQYKSIYQFFDEFNISKNDRNLPIFIKGNYVKNKDNVLIDGRVKKIEISEDPSMLSSDFKKYGICRFIIINE